MLDADEKGGRMPIHIASRRRSAATLAAEFPAARIIDVTSRAAEPWVRLSPFYLPAYRWVLEHRTADLVEDLRRLAGERDIVLLDYTTNGDVADLATPLSHAALVRLHVLGRWPEEMP